MRRTPCAMAGIVLLALYRALTVLASLLILVALISLIAQFPAGESRASAMAGGNGDPDAEFDSPEPYMTFDLFWELPAEGANASQAPPAGLRNETGLGNVSWPLMEQLELMTLLKETLPVVESELLDREAPQEGLQTVPVPEGSSEALQPTGVVKRFGSTEDTKTNPNGVEGMENTADVKITWSILLRASFIGVLYCLIVLLILKVASPWAVDIKKRFTALRANSELLYTEKEHKEFVV